MNKTFRFVCVLIALMILVSSLSCNNTNNPLLGKWSYMSNSQVIVWDFQADGKLVETYGGTTEELKYIIVDADTVRFSNIPNYTGEVDADFTINGDTMTMVAMGVTQEFTRVK